MKETKIFELSQLKKPLTIIDVGALNGIKEPWSRYKKYLQFIGFEPQEDLADSKDTSLKMDNVALSDKKGQVTMFITKRSDSSSLLPPNLAVLERYHHSENFAVVEKMSVETDTLDNQLQKHQVSFVDFIKLDTQGTELGILESAGATLDKAVFGIEVEVNFVERYVGQAHFTDVDNFLRKNGFELFDLQFRFHKRNKAVAFGKPKGQITHGTALYYRTINSAEKIITAAFDPDKQSQLVIRYLLTCLIYGYNDFAWEILRHFKDKLEVADYDKLNRFITYKQLRLPHFPGKYKVSYFFEFISKLFKPYSSTGKTGSNTLGNI